MSVDNEISIQTQALRFLVAKGSNLINQDDIQYNEEINQAKTIFLTTNNLIIQKICLELPYNPAIL